MLERGAEAGLERPGEKALEFKCERMSFPSKGAGFPLLRWIPPSWGERLPRPDRLLADPRPAGKCPKMSYRVPMGEWEKCLGCTGAACMVVCFLVEEVLVGPGGEDLPPGVPPVPNGAAKDRAVVDRRSKNWSERDWESLRRPYAVPLIGKVWRKGRRLGVWGLDLRTITTIGTEGWSTRDTPP